MSAEDIVGLLRCHGRFYTGFISHCQYQGVSKGIVYMNIPKIRRVITIWDKVFFELKVYFDGLVSRKKVFSESSHRIERHIGVFVEVLEVQSSVAFYFCLEEEFIEFW